MLAQLDRVPGYEPVGRGFESLTPCQQKSLRLVRRLFCWYDVWGETSVQAASRQEDFHSVAPKGRGVQLDQPAEGGVWVQNPLHRANKRTEASCLGSFVDTRLGPRISVQTAR